MVKRIRSNDNESSIKQGKKAKPSSVDASTSINGADSQALTDSPSKTNQESATDLEKPSTAIDSNDSGTLKSTLSLEEVASHSDEEQKQKRSPESATATDEKCPRSDQRDSGTLKSTLSLEEVAPHSDEEQKINEEETKETNDDRSSERVTATDEKYARSDEKDSGKFQSALREGAVSSHSDEEQEQKINKEKYIEEEKEEIIKDKILILPHSAGDKDTDKIPIGSLVEGRRNEMLFESNFDSMKDIVAAEHDLQILEELGKGSYGRVYNAYYQKRNRAVKIKYVGSGTKERADFEETALKTLNEKKHQNIIRFLGAFSVPNFKLLLMEKCDCTLTSKIPRAGMTEDVAKGYFQAIISGLNYMHQCGIGHCDVKPDNILLHDDVPKLIDYGFAVKIDGNPALLCYGTPAFTSPEVHKHLPCDVKEVDIWSAGCVLWCMLTGILPFAYDEKDGHFGKGSVFYENITNGKRNNKFKGTLSEDAVDLIDSMLCVNPSKRITGPKIAAHKWLQGLNTTNSAQNS